MRSATTIRMMNDTGMPAGAPDVSAVKEVGSGVMNCPSVIARSNAARIELIPSVATTLGMRKCTTSRPLTRPTANPIPSTITIVSVGGRPPRTINAAATVELNPSTLALERSKAPTARAQTRPSAATPVIAWFAATFCAVVTVGKVLGSHTE